MRLDEGVPEDDLEILGMPLSGLLCQRRRDGRWRFARQAPYDDEEAGRLQADPGEWVRADLPVPRGGRAQWARGAHNEPSWWLLYGDNRKGPVNVTLADGQTPPIVTLGPLWVCEWQEAQVTVGSETYKAFRHIPGYIRGPIGPGVPH